MNRRMVYVRWRDHHELSDESTITEEVGPAAYHSVGFVTGETEEWLEISRDVRVGETDKAASLCILKGEIVVLRELDFDNR